MNIQETTGSKPADSYAQALARYREAANDTFSRMFAAHTAYEQHVTPRAEGVVRSFAEAAGIDDAHLALPIFTLAARKFFFGFASSSDPSDGLSDHDVYTALADCYFATEGDVQAAAGHADMLANYCVLSYLPRAAAVKGIAWDLMKSSQRFWYVHGIAEASIGAAFVPPVPAEDADGASL